MQNCPFRTCLLSVWLWLWLTAMAAPAAVQTNVACFVNPQPISIPDSGPGTPYPAANEVAGVVGVITEVSVTLSNLQHSFAPDLDILLVGPGGEAVVLMSDVGGQRALGPVTMTFSDVATQRLPVTGTLEIQSGSYLPANAAPIEVFDIPGVIRVSDMLKVFNGSDPNGVWQLFVIDDSPEDNGEVLNGWSLTLKTVGDDISVQVIPSKPMATMGESFTWFLRVTNSGPGTASQVVLTNSLPAEAQFLAATISRGSYAQTLNKVTFTLGDLPGGSAAEATIQVVPFQPGLMTNLAEVARAGMDGFLDNNTVRTVIEVLQPTLNVHDASATESDQENVLLAFPVSLWPPVSHTITATYAITNGSAIAGRDFQPTNGLVVFPAGTTTQFVQVPITGDVVYESAESLGLRLLHVTNVVIGRGEGNGSIVDNDPLPRLTVVNSDVVEGQAGIRAVEFLVRLAGPTEVTAMAAFFTRSDSAGATDFVPTNGVVVFPPGTSEQAIPVFIRGDLQAEPDETFFLVFTNVINAVLDPSQATCVIRNDDRLPGQLDHFDIELSATPAYVKEPFLVRVRAEDAFGTTVSNFNGMANLAGWRTSSLLITEIDLLNGGIIECGNVSPASIDLSGWRLTVYDRLSWPYPALQFVVPPGTLCRSNEVFTISGSTPDSSPYPHFGLGRDLAWTGQGPLAVLIQDQAGTVVDFVCAGIANPAAISEPVVVLPDAWSGIPVTLPSDSTRTLQRIGSRDDNQAINWTLSTPTLGRWNAGLLTPFVAWESDVSPSRIYFSGGMAEQTVTLFEPAPFLALRVGAESGVAGMSQLFPVLLKNDVSVMPILPENPVVVDNPWSISLLVSNSGPAIASSVQLVCAMPDGSTLLDSQSTHGSCTPSVGIAVCNLGSLAAGETARVDFLLRACIVGPQVFQASVTRGGTDPYATNNHVNFSTLVVYPTLSVRDVQVQEPNGLPVIASFSLELSAPITHPVFVSYFTAGLTAQAGLDFIPVAGQISIPPGTTNFEFGVEVLSDMLGEPVETFQLILTNAVNATLLRSVAFGGILDNDPPTNDRFENRLGLSGTIINATGFNGAATLEDLEPKPFGSAVDKSVWWTWTAPISGPVILMTGGSDFENGLAVFRGNWLHALTLVASDHSGIGQYASHVMFQAEAGTTYQIAVYGWNGAGGNIQLQLRAAADAIPLPNGILRPDFWDTDGTVHTLLATNGRLYLGGSFSYVGPKSRKVFAVDAFTATADTEFPAIYGARINSIIEDGQGGWFIAGKFNRAGNISRLNLVHVLPDNTVDPGFHPDPDDAVRAMILVGDILYIGGDFLSLGGVTRRRAAAIQVSTGQVLPWSPEVNRSIHTLAATPDAVLAGGEFTLAGGQSRMRLAALDIVNGDALAWNPGADGPVFTLALDGGQVIVGGRFNWIGGELRNHLAAVSLETGWATLWNPHPDGTQVNTLAVVCNTVYVGGDFSHLAGQPRASLAAIDLNTGLPTDWQPALEVPGMSQRVQVRDLKILGNRVYAAGDFVAGDGDALRDLAVFDMLSGRVLPWDSHINGGVTAIGIAGRKVLASSLVGVGGVARRNAAALNLATGRALDWDPGTDGPVFALAFDGNTVYLGGDFTNVARVPRARLAGVDPVFGQLLSWAPAANGAVRAMALSGSDLFVGGDFTEINGMPRTRVAAISTLGDVYSWAPYVDAPVRALIPADDGAVYLGGDFTRVANQIRFHLGAVEYPSGNLRVWDPRANGSVYALAESAGLVYVGGAFTQIAYQPHSHMAAVSKADAQPISAWQIHMDADVHALALAGNYLFVGGSFTAVNDLERLGLAAVDVFTGNTLAWAPGASDRNQVLALASDGGAVFVGGERGLHFQSSAAEGALAMFPPLGAPILLRPLINQEFIRDSEEAPTQLQVEAFGQQPLTYHWSRNGVPLFASGPVLTSSNSAGRNLVGQFSVIVSNALGTISSEAAISALEPVSIDTHPASQFLVLGENIVISVAARGQPAPVFQWRRNGVNIPGAVSSTLYVTNSQIGDSGTYSVVVANPLSVQLSAPAQVAVSGASFPLADNRQDRFLLTYEPGQLHWNNADATVEPGEPRHAGKIGGKSVWVGWRAPANGDVTFDTRGSGFDTLLAVYTAKDTGLDLVPVAADDDSGGFFNARVQFYALQGIEYLVAIDGYAGASGNIELQWAFEVGSPSFPVINSQPQSQSVAEGQRVEFSVGAAGPGPLRYQWLRGCREIDGATNATLVLPSVRWNDIGVYHVRITSAAGRVLESGLASLEITPDPGVLSVDKVEDLFDLPILPSKALAFGPDLAGGSVAAGFISVPLGGTVSQQFVNTRATTGLREPGQCNLLGGASKWIGFIPADNGVIQMDTIGSAIDTILAVYTTNGLFSFTQLACDDNGAPDRIRSRLRFTASRNKAYYALVDGIYGAEGFVRLNWNMGRAPVFIGSAYTYTGTAGKPLLLRAEITNAIPPASFQWRRNGQSLPGATNQTLTFDSLQSQHAGSYSVVVYNFAGRITNTVALIEVNVPLRFEGLDPLANGHYRLRVDGNTGQRCTVQMSSNLVNWEPLTPAPVTVFPAYVTDSNAPSSVIRFYRALTNP